MALVNRRLRWLLGICFVMVVSTYWFTINISPSVPYGLYRKVDAVRLWRGDLVLVPAVDFGRAWWQRWLPLLKPIAGMWGDVVCVHAGVGVSVNHEQYGPVHTRWRGEVLPVWEGCHTLGEGEIFVASRQPNSLDSRYFGPVWIADATLVVPVWTWQ